MQNSSEYFYELTPERILAGVERFGFECTGRCLALNSMENRVYEIEIFTSDEIRSPSERFRIVKFYRPGRWSSAQILEEHRFLQQLHANDISVVPPLLTPDGETLLQETHSGIYFALFPKQGGRSPDELTDEQLERVGRLLARMHNVGGSEPAKARLALTPNTYGIDNLRFLLETQTLPGGWV